jgi:hypothetical protein
MITITVNGQAETLENPCPLLDFLKAKGIEPKTVVIEKTAISPTGRIGVTSGYPTAIRSRF